MYVCTVLRFVGKVTSRQTFLDLDSRFQSFTTAKVSTFEICESQRLNPERHKLSGIVLGGCLEVGAILKMRCAPEGLLLSLDNC